jgi:uncharacterized protein YwqG
MDDQLRDRLVRAGLGRVANDILRLTRPCIRLDCLRVDEASLPSGASKVGGTPDLPHGSDWPTWQGQPMAFIAQIRLEDIATYDEEGALPHSGLLSFCCALDDEFAANGLLAGDDDSTSWKVSHFDGRALDTLTRRDAPAALDPSTRFPSCAVTYTIRPTLPDLDSREIQSLGLSNQEHHAYIEIESGADVGYLPVMDLHLLGYPFNLDGSTFVPCYMAEHGINYPSSRQARRLDWTAIQHQAEAEWRLLLQVYSNEEAGMDFGGGGVLHFCIPNDALAARDFTRVRANLQFV